MHLRGRHLVMAALTAIVLGVLAQAPALAATHWQVLHETKRHVKAEACRTAVYTSAQGHRTRAVRWRGDARSASTGGSVQFHNGGGLGPYTSGWVSTARGRTSKVTTTYFLASEAATIQMRVRTAYGTSRWSPARAITSLALC
jgi:hypothetical protein